MYRITGWQACKIMVLHDNKINIKRLDLSIKFLARVVNKWPIFVAWVDYHAIYRYSIWKKCNKKIALVTNKVDDYFINAPN